MARRIRKSPWTKSFQRLLGSVAKSTMRVGTKAVTKAVVKATRAAISRRQPSLGGGEWLVGLVMGARRYHLYKPPDVAAKERLPLLVMLHGCGQDAGSFAVCTQMNRVAARERFFVLYPEQDRLSNPQGCWNWYETRSGLAFAEAAMLIQAIDQVSLLYAVDPGRVAVAGLSAGASMAALLATRYPGRFKAVAMHSGIAPGTAHSPASALGAMRGRRAAVPLPAAVESSRLPPLLVIQGHRDPLVAESNGRAAAQLWADTVGARAGTPRQMQRGASSVPRRRDGRGATYYDAMASGSRRPNSFLTTP